MPGAWPEPFGLSAIESLACGTPVIARRIGALPEILRDGIDGFFGDDVTAMAFKVDRVAELDREAIRASVIDRFSVERMTDRYEAVYERMLQPAGTRSVKDAAAPSTDAIIPSERLAIRREDRLGATSRR
jgi:glycosyltransferase involved in cell wall biosynthesis